MGSPCSSNGPAARSARRSAARSSAPASTISRAARRCLLCAVDPVVERDAVARGERQGHRHVGPRSQPSDAVERDHGQPVARAASISGLAVQPAQHDQVGVGHRRGAALPAAAARRAAHRIRAHRRSPAPACPASRTCCGDPRRHDGVARDHPQHRAAVLRGVVLAARLVVARHPRPRRDRRDQRQPDGRRRLHRVGDVARARTARSAPARRRPRPPPRRAAIVSRSPWATWVTPAAPSTSPTAASSRSGRAECTICGIVANGGLR